MGRKLLFTTILGTALLAFLSVGELGAESSLKFSYTPQEIETLCAQEQARLTKDLDAIAADPVESSTFEKILLGMEKATTRFSNDINPVLFLKYVSPKSDVRAAADKCETQVQQLLVDL